MRDRLGALRSAVSPTGWTVLAIGILSAAAGHWGGYVELRTVALLCALALVVGAVLVRVPTRVEARLELRPPSTMAGTAGRAVLQVTNHGRWTLRHQVVGVRVHDVSQDSRTFTRLPLLRRGHPHRQEIVLPAMERGVVEIGPVGARRTDPLGLFVRDLEWTGVADLAVRPRMIAIDTIDPGYVPAQDGTASEEVSMSDLAFHALREYVPGDDLRHVHWRSSARAGVLHVRQYHDTRRSHVVVVVDRDRASYPRPQDFELALSIATSLVVRLADEGYIPSFGCGQEIATESVEAVLDAACRAALGADDLEQSSVMASRAAPGSSQLVLVSGVLAEPARLQASRAVFAGDVRFLGLTTGRLPGEDREKPPGEVGAGTLSMLRVRRMAELPAVLAAAAFGPAR